MLVGEQESLAAVLPGTEIGDSLAELWQAGYVCVYVGAVLYPPGAPPVVFVKSTQ